MVRISNLLAALVLVGGTVAAVAEPSGTIMVYTSQPSDQISKVVEAFHKTHPKVKVELFRSGTTEVMNKLQAEFAAGRPQADVVLIADAVAMTQLKADGRLMSYPDAPAAKVPPALVDPDRTFFGTKLITTGIVINTRLVTSPPKSWQDHPGASALLRRRRHPHRHDGAAARVRLGLFRNAGEERCDRRQGQRRRHRGGGARREGLWRTRAAAP